MSALPTNATMNNRQIIKYCLVSSDNISYKFQPNNKSLTKLYPDKKAIKGQSENEEAFPGKECMIISILS
jgi:hypothetical protein